MVALLHRKTDGAEEQKCEGALGISRCPTRLDDGHRACRLTFWSMTPHILIQPVSPSHRESLCSLREIRPFDTITDGHAEAPFPMLMSSSLLLGKNNSLMSL